VLSLRRPAGRWLTLLGLFTLIAVSVELAWWSRPDRSLNDWAATQRESLPWQASKVVFDVATPEVALPITLALGVVLACSRRQWGLAFEAAIRVGLVVASVLLLKPLLAVPGPTRNPLGDNGGAFPSGHTASTVVCMALILAWVNWPRRVATRVAVIAVVVAIVGVAVIYVHYHYVSDVVGGVLLGLLVATLPLPPFGRRDEAEPSPASSTGSRLQRIRQRGGPGQPTGRFRVTWVTSDVDRDDATSKLNPFRSWKSASPEPSTIGATWSRSSSM
jgi:membrane-associated phospholipid phosphatase